MTGGSSPPNVALGLLIGLLVGALTLGSASPHLASALGGVDWRTVMYAASALAALGAMLAMFVPLGGVPPRSSGFCWRDAFVPFGRPALRLANFGYLGHMWKLYAMWAWIGAFFHASLAGRPGWAASPVAADTAAFLVIASGAAGCVIAGRLADRIGRTTTVIAAMLVSGSCALLIGAVYAAAVDAAAGGHDLGGKCRRGFSSVLRECHRACPTSPP